MYNIDALGQVRPVGADPTGVSDSTAALQAAINAAEGKTLFLPTGVYAISSTLTLKGNSTYLGRPSGSYQFGQSHPTPGYGVALKWIGATSGIMVKMFDLYDVVFDGIDLDGVNMANEITGFKIYSDNNPGSTRIKVRNFSARNLGIGLDIGAESSPGGTQYQTDCLKISDFNLYTVKTGIKFGSQNAGQGSVIQSGSIYCNDRGIYFYRVGDGINVRDMIIIGWQETPDNGYFIEFCNHGAISLININGESPYEGWKFLKFSDPGTYRPVSIISSNIGPVSIDAAKKIVSFGNSYLSNDVNLNAAGIIFLSMNDYFTTGAIYDLVSNNQIIEIFPYDNTITGTILQRNRVNNVLRPEFKYNTPPVYADNTAALAGGLIAGDIYRTSTGQLMIVY